MTSEETYTVYLLSHYYYLKEVLHNYATILEEKVGRCADTEQEIITMKVRFNSDLEETFASWALAMRGGDMLTDRQARQRDVDDEEYDWWADRLEQIEWAPRETTYDNFIYAAGNQSPVMGWDIYVEDSGPADFADYESYKKFKAEYEAWREFNPDLSNIQDWLSQQHWRLIYTLEKGLRLRSLIASL